MFQKRSSQVNRERGSLLKSSTRKPFLEQENSMETPTLNLSGKTHYQISLFWT
jgi:hypothetical protein